MSFPTVPDGIKIISIGELTRTVKELLEQAFPLVWVAGEISNLSRPSSGHIYLTLKDTEAAVRAVLWRSTAARLRFDPREGLQVIARGRITVYPPKGDYQLLIDELHPKGLGDRELAFRQLYEKLSKLGYFEAARKRPLPRFPRRLALVTSPTGAAVRDMLEILGRRWPHVEVWICPVRVQGDGAFHEIATAVRLLNRLHQSGVMPTDVLVLGRGGGSTEDLWAFNDEAVARAIFESIIPVVSAVGHEIDVTIADLVADLRALTPSAAATAVVPDRTELLAGLADFHSRLHNTIAGQLQNRRLRLDDLAGRRPFRVPLERIRDREQRLDDWSGRLQRSGRQRLSMSRERLEAIAAQLESLSPLNVLRRGYSLTRREADQAVVRDPEQVHPGDRLVTIVQEGTIISRVEELQRQVRPPAAAPQGSSSRARMPS
jgi:exodeoxyribonuclease VII large subunit